MKAPLRKPVTENDRAVFESLEKLQFAPAESKDYFGEYIAGEIRVPASRVSGLGNLLPWLIDIDPFPTATNTNWDSIDSAGGTYGNHYKGSVKNSTGAQNAEISFPVVLAAGTWTFELLHWRDTNRGIYSVRIDGIEKGTIDGYAAASAANVRSTVTGIVVPATTKYTLAMRMATKNASSSSYFGSITAIQLRRNS